MKNSIEFRVWGRYALFTDPVTKIGGEKCSYHIPTYEALKGIVKSIYWKPTIIWHVDRVRVLKKIRTQTKCMKPIRYSTGGNDLAMYTYLHDVEYQVQAHFEWNIHRPELLPDRIDGKHYEMAMRALRRGGRQDIFLGTRECQAYVEPCHFGEGNGDYDDLDEVRFSLMFMGFRYPDETGTTEMQAVFYSPAMERGIINFPRLEDGPVKKKLREFRPKQFQMKENVRPVQEELANDVV